MGLKDDIAREEDIAKADVLAPLKATTATTNTGHCISSMEAQARIFEVVGEQPASPKSMVIWRLQHSANFQRTFQVGTINASDLSALS